MADNESLYVQVQLVDGEVGQTISETVLLTPDEGEDKAQRLNEVAHTAVDNATHELNAAYEQLDDTVFHGDGGKQMP